MCVPATSRIVAKRIKTPTGLGIGVVALSVESTFKRSLLCNFHCETGHKSTSFPDCRSRSPFLPTIESGIGAAFQLLYCTPLALPPHLAGTGPSSAFLSLSPPLF